MGIVDRRFVHRRNSVFITITAESSARNEVIAGSIGIPVHI
jgi:hypothetical protein